MSPSGVSLEYQKCYSVYLKLKIKNIQRRTLMVMWQTLLSQTLRMKMVEIITVIIMRHVSTSHGLRTVTIL
ncbi:hypothetical protein FKM82_013376 [Ascaphus truei]